MNYDEELREEIFQAAIKVIRQGCAAVSDKGYCTYMTDTGNKCAIGHMMTEKELELFKDEVGGVVDIFYQGWRSYISTQNLETLTQFQICHDKLMKFKGTKEEFASRFISYIHINNLLTPEQMTILKEEGIRQ